MIEDEGCMRERNLMEIRKSIYQKKFQAKNLDYVEQGQTSLACHHCFRCYAELQKLPAGIRLEQEEFRTMFLTSIQESIVKGRDGLPARDGLILNLVCSNCGDYFKDDTETIKIQRGGASMYVPSNRLEKWDVDESLKQQKCVLKKLEVKK